MIGFELSFGARFLIFIIGMALGFLCLLKTLPIGTMIGPLDWAERRFGVGGTFTAVKLFGIFLIIIAVVLLIG